MASVSTARSRAALIGLAVAGALAGSAGGAAAQYYYDYGYEYVPRRAYGYGYGYRYAPPPPAPLSSRSIAEIAIREHRLAQVDRTTRTESDFVVDGRMANGRRVRLIFDRFSGDLVRRVNLQTPERMRGPPPDVARVDPREHAPAQPRLLPLPPERPDSLKAPAEANAPAQVVPASPAAPMPAPEREKAPAPPAEASAPATVMPPSPAAPTPPAEQAKPVEQAPAQARAPATEAPSAPATPVAPTPGPTAPSGEEKPKLVNPDDVRGTETPEHKPPLAKAESPEIKASPVELPPVQIEDPAPSAPRPATPAVPVAPLD